jgi:hypothetical protein
VRNGIFLTREQRDLPIEEKNHKSKDTLWYTIDYDAVEALFKAWLHKGGIEQGLRFSDYNGKCYVLNKPKSEAERKPEPERERPNLRLVEPRKLNVLTELSPASPTRNVQELRPDLEDVANGIFAHWQRTMNTRKARFQSNRKIIIDRLEELFDSMSVSEAAQMIKNAITAASWDDWIMGRNDGSMDKQYHRLRTVLRDGAQVEKFAGIYELRQGTSQEPIETGQPAKGHYYPANNTIELQEARPGLESAVLDIFTHWQHITGYCDATLQHLESQIREELNHSLADGLSVRNAVTVIKDKITYRHQSRIR